jgi:dipeptidyl aminopeptidase/acylaminoacyl peptidase
VTVTRAQGRLPVRACLALIVTALATGAGDAQAAFPGENGRIAVFAEEFAWPPGPFDPRPPLDPDLLSSKVVTYSPKGRGPRVLHALPADEFLHYGGDNGLAWSPNGRLLAFEEGTRLTVVRDDGSRLRRLPQLTWRDAEPAWSPTARRLAFTGHHECGPFTLCGELYTVRRDGSGLHRVAVRAAGHPAWSPTGSIAFQSGRGLYRIRPNGTRLRRLLGRPLRHVTEPDWSPDGRRIVFAARAGGFASESQIFTARADGRRVRRLTDLDDGGDASPAWSPDGRYIAFIRGSEDLYVMRADGRGLRRIVDVGYDSDAPNAPYTELSTPAWQPLPR